MSFKKPLNVEALEVREKEKADQLNESINNTFIESQQPIPTTLYRCCKTIVLYELVLESAFD